MHPLIEEYRASLKMPEAEEAPDLLLFRPLGFLFVKAVWRSSLRPNHVTALSLLAGLAAAWDFSTGRPDSVAAGGVYFALANLLDCADGQLARLQKSGSLLGRVIDGLADYILAIAVFLSLGIGWARTEWSLWVLVLVAGISSALHQTFFDHYQSEFISAVRGEKNFLDRELEQFSGEILRLRQEGGAMFRRFVLGIYVRYMRFQKMSSTREELRTYEPEFYRTHNRRMIRMWSFLGLTTNRTILIVCALIGSPVSYLWGIAVGANLWLLLCYLLQRRIHRTMELASP